MPRLIDHNDRNDEIAAAAFRVLARDGVAALSVRRVADEAGIATASLRRAFPTQDELRRFCFERLQQDVATRLLAVTGHGRERAMQAMRELLPLDEARRTELLVQLQLSRLALTDDDLQGHARELHDGVRRVCGAVIDDLTEAGELARDLDPHLESQRLHALLDGLALHLVWTSSRDAAVEAEQVLSRHLDSLAG
jgi:AcrR family transcriptional regulator